MWKYVCVLGLGVLCSNEQVQGDDARADEIRTASEAIIGEWVSEPIDSEDIGRFRVDAVFRKNGRCSLAFVPVDEFGKDEPFRGEGLLHLDEFRVKGNTIFFKELITENHGAVRSFHVERETMSLKIEGVTGSKPQVMRFHRKSRQVVPKIPHGSVGFRIVR